jgi:hypothetical protein
LLYHNRLYAPVLVYIYALGMPPAVAELSVSRVLPSINVYQQHAKMAATLIALSTFAIGALAAAEPAVTAAAMLDPRQIYNNPALVGYISASSGCKLSAEIIE